jgi:hypothetical protein
VTPPLSSPTGRGAPVKPDWDVLGKEQQQQHPFLAAARPGYCDTPDGARTPVEDDVSAAAPCLGLEFAAVCGASSSKWANGVRVRTRPGPLLAPSGITFSQPWRNPMQKSMSMPVSPVSSRMKGGLGELEFSGALGSLWELEGGAAPEAGAAVKRKLLSADDLELTLGNSSSLRTR